MEAETLDDAKEIYMRQLESKLYGLADMTVKYSKAKSQLIDALRLLRSVDFRMENEIDLSREIHAFLLNCDESII